MKQLLTIITLLVLLPAGVFAATSSDWKHRDEVSVRLIVGEYKDGKALLGLHFMMADKWKTYWRTPGDGGLAAEIDWSNAENVKESAKESAIKWPAPKRHTVEFEGVEGKMENFVYDDELVLPVEVTADNPDKPVFARITVNYSVCDEICVFLTDDFELLVKVGDADKDNHTLISKFADKVPAENGTSGLTIGDISLKDEELEIEISAGEPLEKPDIFIEGSTNFRFPKPEILYSEDRKKAVARIKYEVLLEGEKLKGQELKLTLINGAQAVEKSIIAGSNTSPSTEKKTELNAAPPTSSTNSETGTNAYLYDLIDKYGMPIVLVIAVIGGLILNIMPCVLPVLSIKLISVIKHGGGNRSHIRTSFLTTTAGIIISFMILAGIVIALRSAGAAIGWGFQFQNPAFVIFLTLVMVIFAANQWGFFEVAMPKWAGRLIHHETGHEDTMLGHFMTGMLAALMATPCVAPVMAVAVSFALSQSAPDILLIFTFIGIGLALPYIIFAFLPGLVTKLPKPGMWMIKVKFFLGILLAATALWLVSVLQSQIGTLSAGILLFMSLLIIAMLRRFESPAGKVIIAVLIALSFYFPISNAQRMVHKIAQSELWQKFDQAKIPGLVAEGKVIFVDVTADWCLTCKWNKINVINTDEVMSRLSGDDIVAMKADYTSPSKEITDFLRSHNRHGIPFNIVYGKSAPDGIILSEYLNKSDLLKALHDAR